MRNGSLSVTLSMRNGTLSVTLSMRNGTLSVTLSMRNGSLSVTLSMRNGTLSLTLSMPNGEMYSSEKSENSFAYKINRENRGESLTNKTKKVFLGTIACPECQAEINIFKETEIIEAAVPAEKEERLIAERLSGKQTTLDEETKS
jgi:hypothetical protein